MAKKGKSSKSTPEPTQTLASTNTKSKKKKDVTPTPSTTTTQATTPKPQRGLAIGDNFGWTGKLPVTLLNEHCQKQKWGKCQYDMSKKAKGFVGIVTLTWENPKTKELIPIKFYPNYSPKETTNEARHMVATFVLHRINYIKNMKMLLPIIFRDYWNELEDERLKLLKENKELHDKRYNTNPFTVYLQQRENEEKKAKERQIKEQNELKTKKPTISLGTKSSTNSATSATTKPLKIESDTRKFPKKVWEQAPFIDIPSDIRTSIEHSIRNHIDWVNTDQDLLINNLSMAKTASEKLSALGFRESHIKESFNYSSRFSESLEWLLFHIPEDDLPQSFVKTDKDSKVQLKISQNLEMEYLMKRMANSGFDQDEILEVYNANNNDEHKTCVELTKMLLPQPLESLSEPESQEIWNEEIEGLEMTGIPVKHEKNVATIKLEHNFLNVKIFKSENYPNEIPGIHIVVSKNGYTLANYIKLAIVRELLKYLTDHIGQCMIYTIFEWLNDHVNKIIENPGPLMTTEKVTKKVVVSQKGNKKDHNKSVTFISDKDIELVKESYKKRKHSDEFKEMLIQRSKLPAFAKQESLMTAINSGQVTLITGETGSGKSTQVVQFIMDDLYSKGDFTTKIICTQPRRLSAVSLADRISKERVDEVGSETGYIIRGENKTSSNTRITFATTGVLLRMLQSSKKNGVLKNIGYILIDEVHERSVDADFLLILLKKMIKSMPKLKIILLSATISVDTFINFFEKPLTPLHIEGRTYPIQDFYLDSILAESEYKFQNSDGEFITPLADSHFYKSGNLNYELIAHVTRFIDKRLTQEAKQDGSILIFLPGVLEISNTIKEINKLSDNKFMALPLHSGLTSAEQKSIFKTAPKGKRKVVVSTNIAETSITIPDCVAVIDTGKSKNLFFDHKLNTTKLIESWCSQAEVRQRRGRAGRVTAGTCYHLYTKETFEAMQKQPIPEIKRTRLENLYLVVKSMGISNVNEFLSSGLDAPDKSSLDKANQFLHEIGALQENSLTKLGNYISYLPTDPQSAKLLILGCIFGCLDICLTLAAISSTGSPFINSYEQRDKLKQIQKKFGNGQGDFISMTNAYNAYMSNKSKRFLTENYLSYTTIKDITSTRSQYLSLLVELGFVNRKLDDSCNKNAENWPLIRGIIAGAFYPQVARIQYPDPKYFKSSSGSIEIDPDARQIKFWIKSDGELPAARVFIHPLSVLFNDNNSDFTLDENYKDFLSKVSTDDGSIDYEKAREQYMQLAAQTPKSNVPMLLKDAFVAYRSSHHTTKLYVRDLTPTSTFATLLFGGDFSYDLNITLGQTSPGIVIDNWLPIRTWCKNGVLIKHLRRLIDSVIDEKLSNPESSLDEDIFKVIERIINL